MAKFQLVIQLPNDYFATHEDLIAFEDRLIASMPRTCEVDYHDYGPAVVNFYVYTDAPEAAHRTFRKYLGTRAVERHLRIAYRPTNGSTFTNLWPRRDPRPFAYSYDAKANPFARGATRAIPKRTPPKSAAPKAKPPRAKGKSMRAAKPTA